jgi:hypothetical protein
MDDKPFLVLDLSAVDATLLPELAKLTKESFDLDSVINAPGELKYIGQIKRALASEFKNPSADWVRLFTSRVYGKNVTAKVREQFESLVFKAASQFLNEQVNDRLKAALGDDVPPMMVAAGQPAPAQRAPTVVTVVEDDEANGDDTKSARLVVTTDDEIEGFQIIRAIVCSEVGVNRVAARDTQTYFGVLLDDNNRKPIARLWFNHSQKYLGVFDENKVEARLPIDSPQDIYSHADILRETVARYVNS